MARQHTTARYWHSNSMSVCPSVCPLRSGIVWKRLNKSSQPHDSPIILVLWVSNTFAKFRRVILFGGAKYRWSIKMSRFSTSNSLYLAMIQDSAIVIIEGEHKTAPELSNGTSFNDLEWPLTQISKSSYYSTPNNSKKVLDSDWLTMADE